MTMALLPDFPWDSLAPPQGAGEFPRRRHRRPLGRHAGRPDARGGPGGPGRRRRRTRATRRPGAPRRCAKPSPPGSPAGAACRASTRTACCRRSAARSWSPGCRRCSGIGAGDVVAFPDGRLPDVRRRRAHRRRDAAADAQPHGARPADHPRHAQAVVAQQSRQPDRSGPAGRAPGQGRGLGPPARGRRRQRRVLRRARLARAEGADARVGAEHPGPARLRRAATTACWPSTRCPSRATSPATVPRSWPAIPHWSGGCSRSASTPGMIVPWPVQQAMVAALGDDAHVAAQRARYGRRRAVLRGGAGGRRLPHRPLRRGPLPVGHPRRGRLDDASGGPRRAGDPRGARAASTARPAPSTCGSP